MSQVVDFIEYVLENHTPAPAFIACAPLYRTYDPKNAAFLSLNGRGRCVKQIFIHTVNIAIQPLLYLAWTVQSIALAIFHLNPSELKPGYLISVVVAPVVQATKALQAFLGVFVPAIYFTSDKSNVFKSEMVRSGCMGVMSYIALNEIYGTSSGFFGIKEILQLQYRADIEKISDALLKTGNEAVSEDRRVGMFKEIADAFAHCVPGWGATLNQFSQALYVPATLDDKLALWEMLQFEGAAVELAVRPDVKGESHERNVANQIMHLFAKRFGFPERAKDPYGGIRMQESELLLLLAQKLNENMVEGVKGKINELNEAVGQAWNDLTSGEEFTNVDDPVTAAFTAYFEMTKEGQKITTAGVQKLLENRLLVIQSVMDDNL